MYPTLSIHVYRHSRAGFARRVMPALWAAAMVLGCSSGSSPTSSDTVSSSDLASPTGPDCTSAAPCDGELGATCAHNDDCDAGFVCNWGKGYVCGLPSLPGEPCRHPTDCHAGFTCPDKGILLSECECDRECPSGTSCGLDGCVAPGTVADGEACAFNANCADGTICAWDSSPYLCRPPSAAGESCGHDTDCAEGVCDESAGTCEDVCWKDSECSEGTVCWPNVHLFDGGGGECRPRAALGETCSLPSTCEPGLVCDHANLCAVPVTDGDACQSSADCNLGSICIAGACGPPPGMGETCDVSFRNVSHPSCSEGLVCLPTCSETGCTQSLTCQPPRQEGDFCGCDPDGDGCVAIATAQATGSLCVAGTTCEDVGGEPAVKRCQRAPEP